MNFKVNSPGLFLKKYRKELKLTLKDVADVCGITVGYLSRIENGSSLPSLALLNKLSVAYHFEVSDILDGPCDVSAILNKENQSVDLKKLLQHPAELTFNSYVLGINERKSLERCLNILSKEQNIVEKNVLRSLLITLEKEGDFS